MTGLTYTTYVSSLANLLVVPDNDTGFQTVLPNIIDDAELRMYRDLDLLNTVTRDETAALVAGNRNFNLPSTNGTFVVAKEFNVITPAGTAADSGTRNSLVPATAEMLDVLYPSVNGSTVPQYFAMLSQSSILVGPWPDAAYTVEVVGTIRPIALSSTNTTTLLSVYFPDLLIAASMVFAAGYQRNFGAAVDDPKMAPTWESHYQSLLAGAMKEEDRKRLTEHAIPQAIPPSPTPRV